MSTVSIILPSYNHAKFLKKRLDTLVNQTYKDWELIIIDDCSTDGSMEILKDFVALNNSKISHFIINEKNSGSGYLSWQKGIALANSKYIWIAETDDYSDLHFLEEQIKILDKTDAEFTFCASNYVDINENYLYNSDKRTKDLEVKKGDYKVFEFKIFTNKMPFETYITNGSSVVFRKPKGKIPDEIFSYKQSSDQFLWTFLIDNKSFAFLNKNLNYFRRHENSVTYKISRDEMGIFYGEKIAYLKFFNQNDKYKILIKHYIKYYIWNNKKKVFNTRVLKEIDKSFIILEYYLQLTVFLIYKIFK